MTPDRIIALARGSNGFVVSRNTQESTVKIVQRLIDDNKLTVSDRFERGQGVRLRAN